MKLWRVLLVMVLCVLLPWRGAVAAVMPCGTPLTSTMAAFEAPASTAHASHLEASNDATPTDAAPYACEDMAGMEAGTDSGSEGHLLSHACSACAGFCCAALLNQGPAPLPCPPAPAATIFPALVTPAPSFVVEGPERPPRSV